MTFSDNLRARIGGRCLRDLAFVEIFAGTAKLAAAVKRVGLGDCFGVDARVSKAVHAPILKLDLLTQSGQDSLFAHVSPPSVTPPAARRIKSTHLDRRLIPPASQTSKRNNLCLCSRPIL